MQEKNYYVLDEKAIQSLGEKTLRQIKTVGSAMDAEIDALPGTFEHFTMEGTSQDKRIRATVGGNYKVLEISMSDTLKDKIETKEICQLITEAINDALYKLDLAIETELSFIEYRAFGKLNNKINR